MQFRKKILLLVLAGLTAIFNLCTAQEALVPEFISADTTVSVPDDLEVLIISLESKQKEGFSSKEEGHIEYIVKRYKVPRFDAEEIVFNAKKNSNPIFPKYADILAISEVESHFDRKVSSRGNCLGLMQLKYAYHKGDVKHRKDLFDIDVNMRIATTYLSDLFSQVKKSERSSYSAFNTGLGSFLKGKRNQVYIARVVKARLNFV